MKVIVLYRPSSEYARVAETFVRDFGRRYGDIKLETLNIDTREGAAMASLYGLMQHPAIMALSGDGGLLKSWEGSQLPLMDEVASYVHSA